MKIKILAKGLLGLALIYLVCLPICAIGSVAEASLNRKRVEFSPTVKGRVISPNGDEFIDGYFNEDSGELIARQSGRLVNKEVEDIEEVPTFYKTKI